MCCKLLVGSAFAAETHHQGFLPLAGVLAEQLRATNAPLSVRPDHAGTACAITVDGPDLVPRCALELVP